MTGKAIIISAPSGAGKTTVIRRVMEIVPTLEFSVSACTRKPRQGEKPGIDYHFLSVDAFRQHIANDDFIEWEEVYAGFYYGTLKSELERIWDLHKIPLFEVDIQGGLKLKTYFGAHALALFIRPPDIGALENRLRHRGTEDEESLAKRIGKAALELTYANRFDRIVVNDHLEDAIRETTTLISQFLQP
jgi:guanylate kinase